MWKFLNEEQQLELILVLDRESEENRDEDACDAMKEDYCAGMEFCSCRRCAGIEDAVNRYEEDKLFFDEEQLIGLAEAEFE